MWAEGVRLGLDCIVSKLSEHRWRRVSPEWGCGGIFGLTYTGEVLYYTLAFDAVSYFYHSDCTLNHYSFKLLGDAPRSGGDTYNAATWVDDRIYFGGWVHAPAVFRRVGQKGLGEITFTNKYSHVHEYDAAEKRTRLLWSERGTDPRLWVGEVTDLVYNPLRDSLLVARGDGHLNLGVYEIDRRSGAARRVTDTRVLRGTIYMDHACFSLHGGWGGSLGALCLDLENYGGELVELKRLEETSIDGGGSYLPRSGDVASIDTWLVEAMRGGILLLDPFGPGEHRFARLLDFHYSPYGPLRSNVLSIGGGLLVAFNSSTHSTIAGTDEVPGEQQKAARFPPTQTLLVYISPPVARIVAALGVRVTSMTLMGDRILIATSTCPNLERYDAIRVDHSIKTIVTLPHHVIDSPPPPLAISVSGWMVMDEYWGGIPLTGYREAALEIISDKSAALTVYTYTLLDSPGTAVMDRYTLQPGKNRIDLTTMRGLIASFKLSKPLPRAMIRLIAY